MDIKESGVIIEVQAGRIKFLEEELDNAVQREAKAKKEKFEAENEAYKYKNAYIILIKTLTQLAT